MKRSRVSNASRWHLRIWWQVCVNGRRAPSPWPWKAPAPRIRARRIRRAPIASQPGNGTRPQPLTIGSTSRSNPARRNNLSTTVFLKGDPDEKFRTFGINIEKSRLLDLRRREAGAQHAVTQREGNVRTQSVERRKLVDPQRSVQIIDPNLHVLRAAIEIKPLAHDIGGGQSYGRQGAGLILGLIHMARRSLHARPRRDVGIVDADDRGDLVFVVV